VRLPPQEDDYDEPWAAPPSRQRKEPPILETLPQTVELVLGNEIYIEKHGLPPALRNRLVRLAAFQNPESYQAQAMRLSTYGKPRIIACAEDHGRHIGLPRGCLDDVRRVLTDLGVRTTIRDQRNRGQLLQVTFEGQLRPEQQRAAEAMLAHETGVLAATTAFGKTVVAAWLIAQRGVNTLVLVHRRHLLDQWVARLSTFLGVPAKSIGRIGGGRSRPTGLLDVAVMQSLVRKGVVDGRVSEYGHLIVDECHHLSAQSFERVVRQAKARFVAGLSATVARKDGHHPIIFMQCGPVRHRVDAKAQAASRPFEHFVTTQPTAFQPIRAPESDTRIEFQTLYQELVDDESRNRRICEDVIESVRGGRSPLVLTERNDHLDRLESGLAASVPHLVVLRAGMGKKQRQAVADRLSVIPREEARVILATGKYIGEGFDDSRLDTLFLTLPVSWRGTIAQYAGRLHRLHDGKREVRIYDYADLNVPMLARMFDRRCRGHEAIGYRIVLPASAIPGWPADVPLPADPVWKRDYSASVRRLVRAGVDTPLATLFVHVARTVPPDAEGTSLARSATEAFLYRRLRRPCQKPRGGSASISRCRSRSTAWEDWRSICCATMPVWRWSWTAPSISRIRPRTVATGARTSCCRRTATWSCVSLPRMLAGSSTWYWTAFFVHSVAGGRPPGLTSSIRRGEASRDHGETRRARREPTEVLAHLCRDSPHDEDSRPPFDRHPRRARLGLAAFTDDARHVRLLVNP